MHRTSVPLSWRNIEKRSPLINKKGKVIAFSEIHNPPDHLEKTIPYTIAIIELEKGHKVTGQIVDSENIKIGSEVESCLRKMFEDKDDGLIHYGVKWRLR